MAIENKEHEDFGSFIRLNGFEVASERPRPDARNGETDSNEG
nr:MAG TPA: hypothetical protein [Caudoviricetes sp.]